MTIVETATGPVSGSRHGDALRFAGIPYAAPPVGPLRFRPPEPPEPWSEPLDATRPGPAFAQPRIPLDEMLGLEREPTSEEALLVNVFTPATEGRRPVLVWIHGGAFVSGSGSMALYDGSRLAARHDVVVVTINYRLGPFGFLYLGHLDDELASSGNVGILDMVRALEWVRDNVEAFGGDPSRVCIFGESAGGMSVATLLAVPAARGLFHRAVAQSGAAHNVSDVRAAERVADRVMELTGATTLAELRELPTDALVEACAKLMAEGALAGSSEGVGLLPFQPVCDGVVLPRQPLEAIRSGEWAEVPVVVGTCRDEWNLFLLMDPSQIDEDGLRRRIARIHPEPQRVIDLYREEFPSRSERELWAAVMTDVVFTIPAVRLAEAVCEAGSEVFCYSFEWPTPILGGMLGSPHAIELPFLFGMIEEPWSKNFVGENPPRSLSDCMQEAWTSFAKSGRPESSGIGEWPSWCGDAVTVVLDEECRLRRDPFRRRRDLWSGVL
ncbi:MAG: para-nitrobenzyl esterase [Acidimicrobiales bacterium]|nr:MAG: para-nitrobenzyl esterase [Acidimicrobiales bacterium]